jgi:hypothetical protein
MAYYPTNQSSNGFIGATVPLYSPGTVASGQLLKSSVSNGSYWTTNTSVTPNEIFRISQTNPASIEVKGRMILNGKDLEERLNTIEKVLQIPERDVKLEKKHPNLKKLYDDYINALGKYRTFEAIKGDEK